MSRSLVFHSICVLLCVFFLSECKQESSEKDGGVSPKLEQKTSGKRILFFGDSLTAGYGLNGPEESFVHLVFVELKKKYPDLEYVNAGVSGDTTSGGLARLDWVLHSKFDVFVLELGANDSLRGVSPKTTESNLREIIRKTREKFPSIKILLIGMRTLPNMGPQYTKEFAAVFPKVAKEEKVTLMPFLLEGVAGNRSLNQNDGIHPTAEGHKILAKDVLPYVAKLLK
ncbi:arylesterase [Leptospira langatensis]|uniref:Arylesterase n=1 Tax=Leptospira langatensis TaxID=2484983 RepID=A0A5F1ZP31_9LEPT|nr:arylesterase [Leptospira langatensis]TGK05482.1 arylesterase [Leptospira langatensis]TGL38618.1 arylesterase [Leptospira langatensis]